MTNIHRLPLRSELFSVANIINKAKQAGKNKYMPRKVVQLEYRNKKEETQ